MDPNTMQQPQPTPQPEPLMSAPQQFVQPQAMQQPVAEQPQATPYTPPRPPVTAIYPEPNTPQPQFGQGYSHNGTSFATPRSGSSFALILAIIAVAILPLLIFEPGLVGSMTAAAAWIIVVLGLSATSVFLAVQEQKKSADVKTSSLVALVLGCVMLVMGIVVGSYYIKLQMTISSFRSSFSSNR